MMVCLIIVTLLLADIQWMHADVATITEDITIKFVEPIDVANKLLYDLDHQIQLMIKSHNSNKSTSSSKEPNLGYSSEMAESRIEIISKNAENQYMINQPMEENNVAHLVNNLGELDKKLQVSGQLLHSVLIMVI